MVLTDLVFIDDTGYHYADYPAFLLWRQDQFRAIYGADVYLESDSQDGQLLAIQAKADFDTAALGAATYASFSPTTAQGVGLSRNVKINGISRQAPSFSTVPLDIVGTAGTVITNGVVTDAVGLKWNLPALVTIPFSGTIQVTGTAATAGAITAASNTIQTIFTPTLGWQTVNNPTAANIGAPVESDAALRIRQTQSVADPSLTVFDGTMGGVENIPGVTKSRGYENDTAVTDVNGIPSHSIEVVVQGGNDTAIANEIALHKTPGTGTAGSTVVLVTDAHGMPLNIRFQRPILATIAMQITVQTFPGYSSDYTTAIKQALADAINALLIGDDVLYTKLFLASYLPGVPGSTYDVTVLLIKKNAGPFGTSNLVINFNELSVCDPNTDVTVTLV